MKRFFIILVSNLVLLNASNAQFSSKAWQDLNATGPQLKQIGILAERHAKDIESSPWSVGCETLDRGYTNFDNYKNYVGELGAKSARIQGGWARCEQQKGIYSLAWLDSIVYGLSAQKVNPWICLCYGNPLYGSDIHLASKLYFTEEAMDAWLKWVSTLVTRYKDVVTEWEVWNEPDNKKGLPEPYVELLIKTSEAIKKIQPNATIIGFAVGHIPLKFVNGVLDGLKTKDKLDAVDYLSYHPYSYNPDDSYKKVDSLKNMMQSYSTRMKLFQGENGAPSDFQYNHALNNYNWTETSQAKWYMRRMAGDRLRNIRASVFSIIDIRYDDVLLSFGLIRSNLKKEFIYKKPSYYGVQHMMSIFDNTVKLSGELNFKSSISQGITVAGFKRGENHYALLWLKDSIPGSELIWRPVDITIMNTRFKDPVYVELITGKVYEISKSTWTLGAGNVRFKKLPLWDSPVLITERSEIKLKPEQAVK